MRLTLLFLLFAYSLNAQDSTNYRFSFGVSGISLMHYGLKDLKNVDSPINQEYYKVYETESYDINYQNFNFSRGLNFNFSTYIFNNNRYALKLGANIFFEKFNDKMTYTLTSIGDGSEIDYGNHQVPFTSEDIKIGYSEEVFFSNMGWGGLIELAVFKKLKNNYQFGLGLFYSSYSRSDQFKIIQEPSYKPYIIPRGVFFYNTKKIGLSAEINKQFGRFRTFFNINQTYFTTKKENNKGAYEYRHEQPWAPLSQNLDFRFPLIIRLGVAVEFGKIKDYIAIGMPNF